MGNHYRDGRIGGGVTARSKLQSEFNDLIRANTRLSAPPLVPEIQLHLADEALDLWRLTEADLEASGLPLPFWAFAWAGGQALARFVLDNRDVVAGRSVLVFAAGSGLEAIASVKAGAARVLATDIDPYARAAMALNAAANGVSFEMSAADMLLAPPSGFDVLLLGDVFYERPLADAVVAWGGAAAAAGHDVLLGDPGRDYLPHGLLERVAVYSVATPRAIEDADTKATSVWRFRLINCFNRVTKKQI